MNSLDYSGYNTEESRNIDYRLYVLRHLIVHISQHIIFIYYKAVPLDIHYYFIMIGAHVYYLFCCKLLFKPTFFFYDFVFYIFLKDEYFLYTMPPIVAYPTMDYTTHMIIVDVTVVPMVYNQTDKILLISHGSQKLYWWVERKIE